MSENLLSKINYWVSELQCESLDSEAFLLEHPDLRSQVLAFGTALEALSEKNVEIPDALYRAASHLMEILDTLWDESQGINSEDIWLLPPMLLDVQESFQHSLIELEEILSEASSTSEGLEI